MLRKLTLSAAVAALLAGPVAVMAETTKVGEIQVDAPLAVLGNPEAGALWANLSTDLTSAIAARIAPNVTDAGAADAAKVTVRIEEFKLPVAVGLSPDDEGVLAGHVIVTGQALGEGVALRVTMKRPEMASPPADPALAQAQLSETQYRAMIDAFADRVAEIVH